MANTICPKCNVDWEILAHDQYCGYCGHKVFDFSVEWDSKKEPLFYESQRGGEQSLTLLVKNTGVAPITFEPLQMPPGEAVQVLGENKKFKVAANQARALPLSINSGKLTSEPLQTLTVRPQETSAELKEARLTFRALRQPAFKLTPNPLPIRYYKSTKTKTVDLRLEVTRSEFYIDKIESAQAWIKDIAFVDFTPQERLGEKQTPKSIRLEIDCNALKDGLNKATLVVQLRGIPEPIQQEIRFNAAVQPDPAALSVQLPESHLEVHQNREKSYPLTLKNEGEMRLDITDISFSDSPALVQLADVDFPIHIEGGKARQLDLMVSPADIQPQMYPINFVVTSNCERAQQYQDVLHVTVKPQEVYPHHLAIDFGTTNSCCAYIDTDYKIMLLPLDSEADPPDIMPSSIIYHDHPENEKTYQVGYDAETQRTGADSPYYVSSVKRWLGYGWHRQFPNDMALQPRDVVSDILKHIINTAADYLEQHHLPSKVQRCVVTYPTMFTRQQQDDLKEAFKNIGISELILIDEASAASMEIIFKKQETLQNNYRLLVYDFGGGTIDIVLSHVTIDDDDITIEPIARGGSRRYGGDDVTQAIVDFILQEFKARIQKAHPDLNFDIPYFKPKQIVKTTGNEEIDRATHSNVASLFRRAEEMKKELNTQTETEFFFPLEVIIGNEVRSSNELLQDVSGVKLSAEQFRSFIEPELKETFANIDAMLAENDALLPDTVVLAGQSSRMQLVKDMMATHFQEKYGKAIEIELNQQPKACVVMGAAHYSLTHSLPSEDDRQFQVINLSNKTHSRLGIVRRQGIKPVFGEIIPKDKLIPDESVNITNFSLNSRNPYVDVHEHFGVDNDLEKASRIASYILNLPKDVPDQALREARLKMAVNINGEIELTALVGNDEYTSTVKKQEPEFVDEIYNAETTVKTVKVQKQPATDHQQKVSRIVQDAKAQVAELLHAYREGEPIDFIQSDTRTPTQVLNLMARDIHQWKTELENTNQPNSDFVHVLTSAEISLCSKLKEDRTDTPSPEPLALETAMDTEAPLDRIQQQCNAYVASFERTLSDYEAARTVNKEASHQFMFHFIKDKLFNSLTRYLQPEQLPEQLHKFLRLVDLEVVPITLGETIADARAHQIQDSRQTDGKPGTIVEIVSPGLRKQTDDAIVQKPVVIRGS